MKSLWFMPLGFIAVTLVGQTISNPTGITIYSAGTLTNVYTASSTVDAQSWGQVSVIAKCVTTNINEVANIKPQWSHDSSTWVDVSVLTTNAIVNGGEQTHTLTSKQITLQLTNANLGYVELYPRNARYFRVLVKSTNAFTVGTMSVTAQKLNNGP